MCPGSVCNWPASYDRHMRAPLGRAVVSSCGAAAAQRTFAATQEIQLQIPSTLPRKTMGRCAAAELEANTDAGLVVAFRFPFSHMCRAPPQLTSSWLRYSGRSAPPYCTGERPPSGSTQNHRQADLCNFKITLPGTSSMKFLHKK